MLYLTLHSPLRERGWGFVRVLLVKCIKICLFIYGCSLIVWINCAVRSRASDMFTVHRMACLRSDPVASHRCRVLHEHRFISNLLAKPVEATLPSAGHRLRFNFPSLSCLPFLTNYVQVLDGEPASTGSPSKIFPLTSDSQAGWGEGDFGKDYCE